MTQLRYSCVKFDVKLPTIAFSFLCLIGMPLNAQEVTLGEMEITFSDAAGIGAEKNVMRRDPSDIIKVGDLFYVWYSKGAVSSGYDATVWYATSADGHTWTEKGIALPKGSAGKWDEASVFTPNILVAEGKYWLLFSGISKNMKVRPDTKIGIAASESPDGPWERVGDEPILKGSDNPEDFDSHLIDDACLIKRDGKYWLYYKGRQLGKKASQTQMGLAISDKPEGPYVKHPDNPVIPGNHEVLVWPQGEGVSALIGKVGPKEWVHSLVYAEDGVNFKKTDNLKHVPHAGGAYRPEAFTDSSKGERIEWGVHIGGKKGFLPFIERFELSEEP
ncbi:MAG: family 43 glycosylhydrolase [Akkermansiaceae bacterium]|nr:family 43 glycosylhydrolase [Akkermansiaceae bacterium]